MAAKSKGKHRFLIFQLGFAAVVLALVWYGFGKNVLSTTNRSLRPPHVGTLALVRQVEGPQAISEIGKIHGTQIELTDAYVLEYTGQGSSMTAWVGETATSGIALELIARMVSGIEKGNEAFTNARKLNIGRQEIWQVDGAGGTFFFYLSAESPTRVVWLSIQAADAIDLLKQAVQLF